MKRLGIGTVLIAALIGMGFTFGSRSGALHFIHYLPEKTCVTSFTIAFPSTTFRNTDVTISMPLGSTGCGVQPNFVEVTNSTLPGFGDFLNYSFFSSITPGSSYMGKCDETLNIVCCFHIINSRILDICSGREVN